MNSENSKTCKPHILKLKLTSKLEISKYKFKISAPTWNDEFELPDRSYLVPDIQDYFKYILKEHDADIYKCRYI